MPRFSQQVLGALANPQYGMLTGQAIANVAERASQIPANIRAERERQRLLQEEAAKKEAQRALFSAYASGDPTQMSQVASKYGATVPEMGVQVLGRAEDVEQERATEKRRENLITAAQSKARSQQKPEGFISGLSAVSTSGLEDYIFKNDDSKITQVSRGASLVRETEEGGVEVLYTAPDAPEKVTDKAFELAKTGEFTPASIQDAVQPDGSINYSLLKNKTPEEQIGGISSPAEKRLEKMSEEATSASIALGRNQALTAEIMAQGGKTTGIASKIRTAALDAAGLRDEEEEVKTQFLRTRNTDIINSLPPGVASDTDVAIFSRGFPSEDASAEEITRYLAAESRILAAKSDMSLLADRHLQEQRLSGQDATFVGFEDKKQKYGQMMRNMQSRIQMRIEGGEDPTTVQLEEVSKVSEVLGFTPKFYR